MFIKFIHWSKVKYFRYFETAIAVIFSVNPKLFLFNREEIIIQYLMNLQYSWPFKSQSHKMVKHIQTIRRQWVCFTIFVGLALKGLIQYRFIIDYYSFHILFNWFLSSNLNTSSPLRSVMAISDHRQDITK